MTRRYFMTLAGGVALAWPFGALARDANKIPRIGVLWHAGSAEEEAIYLGALRQGFRDLGYIENKTFILENRFPNEEYEKFFSLASDLVALKVDVFVAVTRPAAIAAKRSTTAIPIVFVAVPDPVGSGIVDSLARPGANITGLSNMAVNLSGKRVELLKEAVGDLSRAALLVNSSDPIGVRFYVEESLAAAKTLGIELKVVSVRNSAEIEPAFSNMAEDHLQGVVVTVDGLFYANKTRIAQLAYQHHLPIVVYSRETFEVGATLSYGPDQRAMFHRAAAVVDQILRGRRPLEMPIEQPTQFELLVNAKLMRAVGLTIAPSLLARADGVIE